MLAKKPQSLKEEFKVTQKLLKYRDLKPKGCQAKVMVEPRRK